MSDDYLKRLPEGNYRLRIERCSERQTKVTLWFVVRFTIWESPDRPELEGKGYEHSIDFTAPNGAVILKRFLLAAGVSEVNEELVEKVVRGTILAGVVVSLCGLSWRPGDFVFPVKEPVVPSELEQLYENLTWHEVDLPWRTTYGEDDGPPYEKTGFEAQARAGMVLRLRDGDVVLIGDLNEAGGMCDCCSDISNAHVVAWADLGELVRPVEVQPTPPGVVRLMVEVDLDDRAEWGVGVVPGSDDELPPPEIISTVLTYVAREHNEQFTQADDLDDEGEGEPK